MSNTRYVLTLDAKPELGDEHGVRRLRMALKRLSRSFGLRAVTVSPELPSEPTNAPHRGDVGRKPEN